MLAERLAGRVWIMGDEPTIADLSLFSWVRALITFYDTRELAEFDKRANVPDWLARILAHQAVQRGLPVPA